MAIQIGEQINALGGSIGVYVHSPCRWYRYDAASNADQQKPHVVVATPGRLVDHLENTKGIQPAQLRATSVDEADRMPSMDFEEELNKILDIIPTGR